MLVFLLFLPVKFVYKEYNLYFCMENSNCVTAPFRALGEKSNGYYVIRQENPVAVLKVYLADLQGITQWLGLPTEDCDSSLFEIPEGEKVECVYIIKKVS